MDFPSLSQMLSDTDFIKSVFFPTNPPFMEEPEFKEFITQMYQLFHTKVCRESVLGNFDTAEHIFSFIDTQSLSNLCFVDKRGRTNFLQVVQRHWRKLLNADKLLS